MIILPMCFGKVLAFGKISSTKYLIMWQLLTSITREENISTLMEKIKEQKRKCKKKPERPKFFKKKG